MLSPEQVTALFSGVARRAPTEAEIDALTPLAGEQAAISAIVADAGFDTGRVVTFYQTFYDRLPDTGGLDFWVAGARGGLTDRQLASEFFAAGEFERLYGGLVPEEQVEALYRNILGREPDPPGLAYWTGLVTDPDNGFGLRELGFEFATASETAEIFAPRIESYQYALARGEETPGTLFGYEGKPGEGIDFDDDDDKVGIQTVDFVSKPASLDAPANQSVADIIALDAFRADPRFAGIDGTGQTVAVIDTGIDLDNAAFGPVAGGVAERIVRAIDFTGERDRTPDDVQGHGTHVASIVASQNPDYLGIAPDSDIAALQGLGNDGSGTSRDIEQALQWVVENAIAENIVAVNLSLGNGTNVNAAAPHPFGYADELEALADLGVIVTAAAGNDYFRYQEPGSSDLSADPNALSVGAVWDENTTDVFWGSGAKDFVARPDQIASFSQRATAPGIDTIFAPGALILGAAPGGGTVNLGGTSQAAPQVAGLAALAQELALQELGRRLTPAEFEQALRVSADTITDAETTDDNVTNTGASFGRVNALALGEAILALDDTPDGPPAADADTVPGDATTGALLALDAPVIGEIDTIGDTDWYRVTLEAGTAYAFSATGAASGGGTLTDPFVSLLDASGRVVAADDDGGVGVEALLEVTAPASGEYFVEARAYSTQTGGFTLAASVADTGGDLPASPATPSRLEPGTVTQGELESEGDRDWHALDVTAGQLYRVTLTGAQGGGGSLDDPFLRVFAADGRLIAENDDETGLDSGLAFTAGAEGTVYVDAGAFADGGTGTYSVEVTLLDGGDVPADPSTGSTLAPGGTVEGELSFVDDADWFAVDLNAGQRYDFALLGLRSGAGTLRDPFLRLHDAEGREIASDDDGGLGREALLTVRPEAGGRHYVSAESYQGQFTGTYALSLTTTGAGGEIPDDVTTDATLAPGGSTEGVLEAAGDADWYRVQLEAGTTYTATLEGVEAGGEAVLDPFLRLFDAEGREITSDDDGGENLDAALDYTPGTSGTFYLGAGSFEDLYAGGYRIALSEGRAGGAGDTVPDDTGTQARVSEGAPATGALEFPGDRDWYGVELRAGVDYVFDLRGAPSGSGTLSDPVLRLHDPAGAEIAADDDGGAGFEARLAFTPETDGLHFLGAGGYNDRRTGTYELSISEGGNDADAVPGDASTDARLPAPGATTGTIDFENDEDWFILDAAGATIYEIALFGDSSGQGSLSDPILRVYDSSGTEVAGDDDGGLGLDARLELPVDGAERFYVSAAGVNGATGSFRLAVLDLIPFSPIDELPEVPEPPDLPDLPDLPFSLPPPEEFGPAAEEGAWLLG